MHIRIFVIALSLSLFAANSYSQCRFKTVRDTKKYSENNLDVKIFRTFNNIESKFIHSMVNITNESIVPVSIALPVLMYAAAKNYNNHYDESSAVLLALAEGTNIGFTQLIKYTVKRDRPFRKLNRVWLTDTTSVRGTFSFPSGHSSESFTIATSLTLRYPDKPALIAGLYTYATLVALGRIYWGVHYPSDVLTGMLVGAGSAALIFSLRKPIIEGKNNLFNQGERTENHGSGISTPAFFITLAATDLINALLSKSENKILKKSKVKFTGDNSQLVKYSFSF